MKPEDALTPGVKSAVRAYLMARAYAETMREKVDEVYREILTECPVYADQFGHTEQILNSKDLYLCSDDTLCQDAFEIANHRLRAVGLKPDNMPDSHCPALVAENIQMEAEQLVIDNMAEALGQEGKKPGDFRHRLICSGLDKYHQFIDLACKLVINAPGFEPPLRQTG